MSSGITITEREALLHTIPIVIVAQRQIVTAGTGARATSVGVGPGANRRWLITHVCATVQFATNPAAGDRGSSAAEMLFAATGHPLDGAEVDEDFGLAQVSSGKGTYIVVDSGKTFRVIADAFGSSVSVTGSAIFMGIDYAVVG